MNDYFDYYWTWPTDGMAKDVFDAIYGCKAPKPKKKEAMITTLDGLRAKTKLIDEFRLGSKPEKEEFIHTALEKWIDDAFEKQVVDLIRTSGSDPKRKQPLKTVPTAVVAMVNPAEKDHLVSMAIRCNLTVSEYLCGLVEKDMEEKNSTGYVFGKGSRKTPTHKKNRENWENGFWD